ncbi:type III pantothenate kinase [Arundinibacter roseus]|uniref:Type III pantothenate kinase n=1 Tax=Arundinibacter roseus TaxID=2070510 RepID=A0A4R4KIW5_9BACT|nr:type III pantothenate kinase [Arundinibacter roseus]TDB68207.1 type III pantothenate kinase [Arundinibacter roseus]
MNIVVDSGNTYAKVGWFSGENLIRYKTRLSFDELLEVIRESPGDNILFSSVGRSAEDFRQALQLNVPILNLDYTTPVPVEKKYDTPQTLGADRIAAAVGAMSVLPQQDLVIIDMGSCITYDFLNSRAQFEGGLISPGMRMRFKAMHSFTQRLPLIEPGEIPALIGKSTKHAMESGVLNGLIAEINGIVDAYKELSPSCQVVLCGGDAAFFESHLKPPIFVIPELVLIGLNRILLYNVSLQKK